MNVAHLIELAKAKHCKLSGSFMLSIDYAVTRIPRFAILRSHGHTDRLPVGLYVKNDNRAAKQFM